MKIVVTGALGHIGSFLIREIPKRYPNSEITMVDNLSTQRYCSLFNLPKLATYRFIEAEVLQEVFKESVPPICRLRYISLTTTVFFLTRWMALQKKTAWTGPPASCENRSAPACTKRTKTPLTVSKSRRAISRADREGSTAIISDSSPTHANSSAISRVTLPPYQHLDQPPYMAVPIPWAERDIGLSPCRTGCRQTLRTQNRSLPTCSLSPFFRLWIKIPLFIEISNL